MRRYKRIIKITAPFLLYKKSISVLAAQRSFFIPPSEKLRIRAVPQIALPFSFPLSLFRERNCKLVWRGYVGTMAAEKSQGIIATVMSRATWELMEVWKHSLIPLRSAARFHAAWNVDFRVDSLMEYHGKCRSSDSVEKKNDLIFFQFPYLCFQNGFSTQKMKHPHEKK